MGRRLSPRIRYLGGKPSSRTELIATSVGIQYLLHCTDLAVQEYFELYKQLEFKENPESKAEAMKTTNSELSEWLTDLGLLAQRFGAIAETKT